MINYARSIAMFRHVLQRLSMRANKKRVCVIAAAYSTFYALFLSLPATADDLSRFRGGIRNSPGERRLNKKQLDAVLASLRDKSGFLEMCFDKDGFLTLGDQTKFSGGSGAARALLDAAIKMPHAVELESHTNSSLVAFARLSKLVIYKRLSSGKMMNVFPLEIDFSDLSRLRGDKQALAAFDLGFVILHELGHATHGLPDASGDPNGLGECEELINRIRRELNLPERRTYVAHLHSIPNTAFIQGPTQLAELVFTRAVEKQGRMQIEKFYLRWEASKVRPITETPVQ